MSKFDELKQLIASMEDDNAKFNDKGNSSAGTRLRKSLQSIKKVAQDFRNEIQEKKNAEKA